MAKKLQSPAFDQVLGKYKEALVEDGVLDTETIGRLRASMRHSSFAISLTPVMRALLRPRCSDREGR